MEKEVKRITNQIFSGIAYDIAGMHSIKPIADILFLYGIWESLRLAD